MFATLLLIASATANAADANFSGVWTIDLRIPTERHNKVGCGTASFVLKQAGDKITGDHTFSTPDCGRVNEGGDGTVIGIAIGKTAVLTVRSGRNGAIIIGRAILQRDVLHWETTDQLHIGEPDDDSALILGKGVLKRSK